MANSGAGSKVDTIVKLALISFVVILSFAVGTFVGKQVSDADYRRAALENDYAPETEARSVASTDSAVPSQQTITDEEIASLREEFEKTEVTSNGTENETANTAATKPSDETKDGYKKVGAAETHPEEAKSMESAMGTAHAVAEPAARVAKALAPAKDVVEKRKPSAALPSVATSAIGKFTVQVASYATEAEAQEQVNKLKGKGFGAFFVSADVKGQTWYRVSVGLFADQASAMDYRQEILNSKSVNTAIVQKIVR